MDVASPLMSLGAARQRRKRDLRRAGTIAAVYRRSRQSDGSKRHLCSDRFQEFGEDTGRKATKSRRRSLSPKKEPGYSSSPRVSRHGQRRHSSFAQGPQLDVRPLPCNERAFLSEESIPTSTSMGDEQGQAPHQHQSARHGDTAAFFYLIKHLPPQTLPALICRQLHHFSSSRSSASQ